MKQVIIQLSNLWLERARPSLLCERRSFHQSLVRDIKLEIFSMFFDGTAISELENFFVSTNGIYFLPI